MASNMTQSNDGVAMHRNEHDSHSHSPKRRRPSWRTQISLPEDSVIAAVPDPHSALLLAHEHEGLTSRLRHRAMDDYSKEAEQEDSMKKSTSKKRDKMIAPYLAHHIPQQYNPLGGDQQDARPTADTKFCYRHRPDMLCRKQADEPTMEMLQEELGKESQADQQSIANVWSLFSAAPARQRNLMLQGILSACCFPQLSFISSNVRNLIKIDFLSALPTELGFKILCYLDTTSLCNSAQVSRRWRQVADDDVVWHKMCEQHIDRKCTKCGWGLPLLVQRQLRTEKRRIQLRASGRGLNEWSPDITPMPESSASSSTTLVSQNSDISETGSKRSAPDDSISQDTQSKRQCSEYRDQQTTYFDQPKKQPWKDIYKARFKVGTNWKYGRCSTRILKGHTNGVMCLQFDEQKLITGSYDATVKVWDLATGEEIRTITGHTEGIRCLQFQDKTLITGSLDSTIRVWDWRTGECKKVIKSHVPGSGVIGLHLAGTLLASGSSDHTIIIHDLATSKRSVLYGHEEWVNCVKFDLPSRTLFSASDDMTIKLWDLDTNTCIRTYEGHVGQVQQVLPLPHDFEIDEADFEDANNDTSDTASRTSSTSDHHSDDTLNADPIFPNDPDRPAPPSYFITAALDGTIRLWHVPTGRAIHSFFGHIEGVWSLAVDSLRLVSGAEDKMIKIWDPRTGKNERTLTGHTGPVNCVGLSDSRLISGSMDGTVRVHCFVGKA